MGSNSLLMLAGKIKQFTQKVALNAWLAGAAGGKLSKA